MPSKMIDETACPFPIINFKGCAVEVWRGISDFAPPFIYICNNLSILGLNLIHVTKITPMSNHHKIEEHPLLPTQIRSVGNPK